MNQVEEGTPPHEQNASTINQQGATLQANAHTASAQNQATPCAFALLKEDVKNATDIARILWEESNMSREKQQNICNKEVQLLQQLADCREQSKQEKMRQRALLARQQSNDQHLQSLQDEAEALLTTLNSAKRHKTQHG